MNSRLRNIAGKLEGSEGVAETLAAADAKTFVYNQKVDFPAEIFERMLERNAVGDLPHVVGKIPGNISFDLEMKGSGVATTEPDWVKYLKPFGFAASSYKSINIGAITAGPFLHGEVVTGGTSTATGRVIMKTTNGASAILVVVLTGTFQSGEVITGGVSGATATTASTATNTGTVILPISTSVPAMTLGGYQDGVRKLVKGARGSNGRISLGKVGDPVLLSAEYSGVEAGVTDNSIFASIVPESILPPVFKDATLTIDGYAAKISTFEIDLGVSVGMRTDPDDDRGILCYAFNNRLTRMTNFDPEMALVATQDFFGKLFAGTQMEFHARWGTSGNRLRIYAPALQYVSVGDGDREGIATAPGSLRFCSNIAIGNDDIAILLD